MGETGSDGVTLQRPPVLKPLWLMLLAGLMVTLSGASVPARSQLSDVEEEANCRRVSTLVDDNSAPVKDALERLARERFGRSLSELSPEQLVQLAMGANVEGRQMTAAQERLQERCDAYRQRVIARQSAAAGIRSLYIAQGYLERWGLERVAGLGCTCADFRPAGEDVDQRCPSRPICSGQEGGARIPDPERGCRSIGAAAWIRRQLPEFYRLLGMPPEMEEVRDVIASLNRPPPAAGCSQVPTPSAPSLSFASVATPTAQAAATGTAFPAAIGSAAACFSSPTTALCQEAMVRGDALVQAARRGGRDRCLGYALTARTLWALGADSRFTDLLISFPEASRVRNEARIALRYLRSDCRGL